MLIEKFLFDKLSHDSVQNFRHDLAAVFGSLPKFIFSLLLRTLSVQTVSTYRIRLIPFETKIINSGKYSTPSKPQPNNGKTSLKKLVKLRFD